MVINKSFKSKIYRVNLDLPPEERRAHIVNDYTEGFPLLRQEIDNFLSCVGYNFIFAGILRTAISYYRSSILYYEELEAISEKTGMSLDKLAIMQLMYELSAACTTIITKVHGNEVMFRTMNWEMPFLKDITIEVEFISKEKSIFRATTWIGYVEILTALNLEHKYSIAVNYQRTQPMNMMTVIGNIISTLNMNWPVGSSNSRNFNCKSGI